MKLTHISALERRQRRVRAIVVGSAQRPRLSVSRSNKHIVVQAIDDARGVTVAHATDTGISGTKTERATAVGTALAQSLTSLGITTAVFDRRGRQYHGRVKAVADAVRAAGITV